MKMIQMREYKGYIQNGRVVSPDTVLLPENSEVIIRVTGKIFSPKKSENASVNTNKSAYLFEPTLGKSTPLGLWEGEVKIPDDFNECLY
jgi:hypothetical protein